jgi:hypothetical protein
VTLWGIRIADQPPAMQPTPRILAPGAPQPIPAEKILSLAQEQMNQNKNRVASIPVVLYLKNEKSEEFLARYVLFSPTSYGPFRLDTQIVSVTRATWSKRSR